MRVVVLLSAMIFGSISALALAQSGIQGSGGSDPSIGDFRYSAVPASLKCSTPGGTAAACASLDGTADGERDSTDPAVYTRDGRSTTKGAFCGNGVCDIGEDGMSCAIDCANPNPSGVGAAIGEGSCAKQAYPGAFPVENKTGGPIPTGATCGVEGQIGMSGGATPFGTRFTLTHVGTGDLPRVVMPTGSCGGQGTFFAEIRLICGNGVFLPEAVSCVCCPKGSGDCRSQ